MNRSPTPRLCALDAFRGFTVAAMILVNNPGSWSHIYPPLRHAAWHGWTPTDLVFPFFLFIAGVAIPLAFAAQRARGATSGELAAKALRRSVVLFALGLVLASPSKVGWGPLLAGFGLTAAAAWAVKALGPRAPRRAARELILAVIWLAFAGWLATHEPAIRIPGVLQRIAVCYLFASLLQVAVPERARAPVRGALVAALLLGYWAILCWVPVPGAGAGLVDSEADNIASYLDRVLLEGHLWIEGVRDPEGPLSTLGALATILFGVAAGDTVRRHSGGDVALQLLVRGAGLVVLGYCWSWLLPINKPLWTSSYAVFTAGQATCALGLCYWAFDLRGHRRWAAPGVTYGLNAITVFVGSGLVARLMSARGEDGVSTKARIYSALHDGLGLTEVDASLAYALLWVTAWWVVLRVMQARGWIVKV